ncbi:hypothetical protein [Streptomyces sp. NPDC059466]|uniref:hypothetical protein n=1 Tax=unclassified Streptomyces TaxID=2593676 RepID=UPI003681ADA0
MPFGQPALVEHDLSVDPWQDVAVHQQVTQVSDGSPGCFLVQPIVSERGGAGRQAVKETDDVGVAEPDQAALGLVHLQQDGDASESQVQRMSTAGKRPDVEQGWFRADTSAESYRQGYNRWVNAAGIDSALSQEM